MRNTLTDAEAEEIRRAEGRVATARNPDEYARAYREYILVTNAAAARLLRQE